MSEQNKIDEIKAANKRLEKWLEESPECKVSGLQANEYITYLLAEVDTLKSNVEYWQPMANRLADSVELLQKEIERKDEALRFYENGKNYEQEKCMFDGNENDVYYEAPEIMLDLGQRAREAL